MPVAKVRVVTAIGESIPVDALIDTGSHYTLIAMGYAKEFLGKSREQIVAEGTPGTIVGIEGKRQPVYGFPVDMKMSSSELSKEILVLRNVILYASDLSIGYGILFGQHSGFENRFFRHHNRTEGPFWEIRQLS
jgi:hypothetical protein